MSHIPPKKNILSTISMNFRETFPGFSLEVTEVNRWDASTGRFRNAIPVRGYGENGIAAAFSPDGSTLALSPAEGLVDVWDLTSGKLIWTLSDQDLFRIDSLAFSPDGSILVAAFYGRVVAWNFGSGEVFWKKNFTEKQTGPIALSPDVSLIAVGAESAVEVWDLLNGARLFDFDAPTRNVTALSFSPDGKLLAAGDAMGKIFQWDAKTGHCLRTYTGSGGAIQTVNFPTKGGNLMAAAAGGIKSWNTVSGERTWFLEDPFSRWEKTRFLPEEGEIAAQVTGKVSLFDAAELKLRRTFEYPEDAVLSPDFSRYVRLTKDAKISVANLESRATIFTWDAPECMSCFYIYSFFLSPDNRIAASIHNDYISPKAADFWSLADGRLLQSVEYASYGNIESTYLEFSPSGGLALLGLWDWEYGMAVKVFDLENDKSMGIFGSRGKYIVAVSEDDRMIATHCELRPGMCVFDLANTSGEEIANFSILDEYETVVAFSPDGKLLAVGSENGLISIWNIADEKLLLSSKGHNGAAINLSFSRDGKNLASTGKDGTVILWDLE
jgi:WD40 repeat protein